METQQCAPLFFQTASCLLRWLLTWAKGQIAQRHVANYQLSFSKQYSLDGGLKGQPLLASFQPFEVAQPGDKKWTNKQAGIRRERGYGGSPLVPFPVSNLVKVHIGGILPYPGSPVSLLVGFPDKKPPPWPVLGPRATALESRQRMPRPRPAPCAGPAGLPASGSHVVESCILFVQGTGDPFLRGHEKCPRFISKVQPRKFPNSSFIH